MSEPQRQPVEMTLAANPASPTAEKADSEPGMLGGVLARIGSLADERKERTLRETIVEFQSDAVEIEQGPPPRVTRMTLHLLLALFAVAVGWASYAHVDRIVMTPGKLITTTPQIVIQPFETAVVKEIRVRPGDVVRAGQVVAVLDSTFAGADLSQLESQWSSYQAQIERLKAQYDGTPYQPDNPANPHAVLQLAIFKERNAAYAARLADIDGQIAQANATMDTLRDNIKVFANRLTVAEKIEGMRQELQRLDAGSRLQSLVAHDQRLQVAGELESTRNRQSEIQHQLRSLEAQRAAFESSILQEVAKELIETTRQYDSVVDALRKARRRDELAALKAPSDAVVLQVAQRTVGSVVQAAEAVVTMVPLDSPLEAEVRIAPEDVGQLTLDLPVKIKLDAFPFQKHGQLEGELILISQNTFTLENRPDGQPYYRGIIKLTKTDLMKVPASNKLLPGMTLVAEIKLGERSVMGYLLDPLTKTFSESMREP